MASSAATASSMRPEREQALAARQDSEKPVSWTTAGLPEARYAAVRSLNQPLLRLHLEVDRDAELAARLADIVAVGPRRAR